MTISGRKNGFTLVELLTVAAILVLLAGALLTASKYVRTQAQCELTACTINVIAEALRQYHNDNGSFPFTAGDDTDLVSLIGYELGLAPGDITLNGANDGEYASIEWMFFLLDRNHNSSKILSAISGKFLTSKDSSGNDRTVGWPLGAGTKTIGLIRIVDVWDNAFRYTYTAGDNFPVIESAGKDGDFGTVSDNILSVDN